jgi:hypothetical protein
MHAVMREPTGPPALPLDPEGSPAARGVASPPEEFAEEFNAELVRALAHVGHPELVPTREDTQIRDLLVAALKDELEAAEIAAVWMAAEMDLELKLGLARQVGDEARHYRLLADRLRRLGIEPDGLDPRARGYSHTFRYLKGLQTAAERLAANAAREGIARLRNALVAEFCAARGDEETARLYREVIGPDEAWHLDFSRRMVGRYALTAEDQERARHAMARTLQLVDDLSEAARAKAAGGSTP